MRLVAITAEEAGVLVGLEVRHSYDHRMRRERRRDRRDALYDPPYKEITRRLVCRNEVTDLAVQRLVKQILFEQRLRMNADLVIDDELQPGQPNSSVRQPGECEGLIRRPDIHHDLDTDLGHGGLLGLLDGKVKETRVNVTGVTLST